MRTQINNKNTYFEAKYGLLKQIKFMEAAKEISKQSSCARANTGAAVVSHSFLGDKVVGVGRSSTPDGIDSCKTLGKGCIRNSFNVPSGTHYETCLNVHAEENAILQAGAKRSKNGTLFLWGHKFLCDNCAIRAINAGIEDFYIQANEKAPIKHLTAQNLKDRINKTFLTGLENLSIKLGKTGMV